MTCGEEHLFKGTECDVVGSTHQWVLIPGTEVEYLVWGIDWHAMMSTSARVLVGMLVKSTYPGVLIGVPVEE